MPLDGSIVALDPRAPSAASHSAAAVPPAAHTEIILAFNDLNHV